MKPLIVGVDCSLREDRFGVCAFVTSTGKRRFCYSSSRVTVVLEMEAILFAIRSLPCDYLHIYSDSVGLLYGSNLKNNSLIKRVSEIGEWMLKRTLVIERADKKVQVYRQAHQHAYRQSKIAPSVRQLSLHLDSGEKVV